MKNFFTLFLLAFAVISQAQTADNIIDEAGITWASYDDVRIVISAPSQSLFFTYPKKCVSHKNMAVTRTECDAVAASESITAVIDFISGHTAIFITTKQNYYAGSTK